MLQSIEDFAQKKEWGLHQSIGHGISGIEKLISSFGSLDFIKKDYLDMLHQYDHTIKILSVVVIIGAILFITLTNVKETPKLFQKIFLGLIGAACFIPLFSIVVGDVGGGVINSVSTSDSGDYGIGLSLINYTLKDYEAEDYHPNFKTWNEIDKIDITEQLDKKVEKCEGTNKDKCITVREKGDYRYEPSLLFGIVMGLILFALLLVSVIMLAKKAVELVIAGVVGLFATVLSMVSPQAPFAKNYWNSVGRELGVYVFMIMCLKSYMSIDNFMLTTYSKESFNFLQSGLMYFAINVAVLWTILDGAKIIEKTFGIDAGISQGAALVAGNNLAKLAVGGIGKAVNKIPAGEFLKNQGSKAANMVYGSAAGSLKGKAQDGGLSGGIRGARQGAREGAKVARETKKAKKPPNPNKDYRAEKVGEIRGNGKTEDQSQSNSQDIQNEGAKQESTRKSDALNSNNTNQKNDVQKAQTAQNSNKSNQKNEGQKSQIAQNSKSKASLKPDETKSQNGDNKMSSTPKANKVGAQGTENKSTSNASNMEESVQSSPLQTNDNYGAVSSDNSQAYGAGSSDNSQAYGAGSGDNSQAYGANTDDKKQNEKSRQSNNKSKNSKKEQISNKTQRGSKKQTTQSQSKRRNDEKLASIKTTNKSSRRKRGRK